MSRDPKLPNSEANDEVGPKDNQLPPVSSSVVYLHPGQIFFSEEPVSIMTILGSCVAVCLWDYQTHLGGMCHYVLPHGKEHGQNSLRFGNVAFAQLIDKFAERQITVPTLRAKVFGGASLHRAASGSRLPLGQQNIETARKLLSAHGIAPPVEDVGGERGRKLIFHLASGDAWVKAI